MTIKKRRNIVYNELLEHGDHTLLWEIYGTFVVRQIEVAAGSSSHQGDRIANPTNGAKKKPASWRDKYSNGDANPLDLVWPILGTGARKALRHWTSADALTHAAYQRKTGDTYHSVAAMWSDVAKAVGKGTLGEAKELPGTFTKWLGKRPLTRIPAATAR